MNNETKKGWTALMGASWLGHLEMVKEYIKSGADVNERDKYGKTALMCASSKGHLEVVKELIKAGADVNAKDDNEETALMVASFSGHLEIVKELIKAGADVNIMDNFGWTALIIAKEKGNTEIVRELEKVKRSEIMNNENNTNTEKIITDAQASKYKNDLAILTQKVQHAKRRIAQANYQYKNSVAKIEKQRQRAEETKELINITKIKIANQLATAQKLQELLEKYEQQKEGNK